MNRPARCLLILLLTAPAPPRAVAQPFRLPTANHALFEPGSEEKFFAGTVGKSWTTGMFGCVRSDGWQIDLRCIPDSGVTG